MLITCEVFTTVEHWDCQTAASSHSLAGVMEKVLKQNLITLATLLGDHENVSAGTIARRYVGQTRFFQRLSEGKTFTVRSYDELVNGMSRDWPSELDWPEHIERPKHKESEKNGTSKTD